MSFWKLLGIVALLWAGAFFVIATAVWKIVFLWRRHIEGIGLGRTAKAIRRFLDRAQTGDVKFCVRQTYYYDEILPEEEAGMPEVCVVCREYGDKEHEDARPPLVTIGGSYIPLCASHKQFVREFEGAIKEFVFSVNNGEAETPSG